MEERNDFQAKSDLTGIKDSNVKRDLINIA